MASRIEASEAGRWRWTAGPTTAGSPRGLCRLSLLGRLFGRRRAPASDRLPAADPVRPEPPAISAGPDRTDPLHFLLDGSHLPWREPRGVVEARCGISRDLLYENDSVFFPAAVSPPGFLRPWRAAVFERYAPGLPIVRFEGLAWWGDDAHDNLRCLRDQFAPVLGGAAIGREWNTLACVWRSGTSSLRLVVWPPEWQTPSRNDAHDREPRLRTAVHATLLTGFRLPLDPREERWLDAFRPVARVRAAETLAPEAILRRAPADVEIEYAREPGDHLAAAYGRVGWPPGAPALVLCTHQLFVVAREDVLSVDVTRMRRAKGPGGASLAVRCRTPCPGVDDKRLAISHDPDPDGMTALGREIAVAFGVPCEVSPLFDDV